MPPIAGNIRQNALRMGQEGPSGLGQLRAIGRTIEKRRTGLRFQLLDGISDGRLGAPQSSRRGGKAAFFGNYGKSRELIEAQSIHDLQIIRR